MLKPNKVLIIKIYYRNINSFWNKKNILNQFKLIIKLVLTILTIFRLKTMNDLIKDKINFKSTFYIYKCLFIHRLFLLNL